jgi:hypothetical protein
MVGCHWAAMVSSGVLIVLAFCWDCSNILAGGSPNPFNWPLFLTGVLLGVVSFMHAQRNRVNVRQPFAPRHEYDQGIPFSMSKNF